MECQVTCTTRNLLKMHIPGQLRLLKYKLWGWVWLSMSEQAPWVDWDKERKFVVRNPPENMKRSCSEDGLFWPYLSLAVQMVLSLVLIFLPQCGL